MIRPGVKTDDKSLMDADLDALFAAKRHIEHAAFLIATVAHCAPLDSDIKSFKKRGCEAMELARRIYGTASAHQDKWEHGVDFRKAYLKALRGEISGEYRFYEEVMLAAKVSLEKSKKKGA